MNLDQALQLFENADEHNTGSLSRAEFAIVCRSAFGFSEDEAHRRFDKADRNMNNGISFYEFYAFAKKCLWGGLEAAA